jgi:hypothetical protein
VDWNPNEQQPRLMADPSLLFSEAGLQILQEGTPELVVSQTFLEMLREGGDLDSQLFWADDGGPDQSISVDQIRELISGVPGFSYQTALEEGRLDEEARLVLERILESGDQLARIDADQWAFLNSHSWLGAQSRRAFAAFRRAGAVVIETSREFGIELLGEVIPMEDHPDGVNAELIGLGVIKWLVVGGAAIGGGTLGGLVGGALGGPIGSFLGGEILEHLAEAGAKRVVVAIDP